MRVWRIASARHQALDGEGARVYGGRWTPKGIRAVYASATLSLAALERYVHIDTDIEVPDLVAMAIDLPDAMPVETIDVADLPWEWRDYPSPLSLQSIGERWVRAGTSAILSVPSAIVPLERNYVINPGHDAFASISIPSVDPFTFDPRLRIR